MNKYFKNSEKLLRIAESKIKNEIISYEEMISATLFFGIGIESLMKGIIYDVNPVYVYEVNSFSNAMAVVYKEKIKVNNIVKSHEQIKKTNENVISFSKAFSRAEHLSKTTHDHKATICRLKDARDIIAHCPIDDFDLLKEDRLKNILNQFHILVSLYEKELNLKFIESEVDESEATSHLLNIQTKIQERIAESKQIWNSKKDDANHIQGANIQTMTMDATHPDTDNSYLIECPACSKEAVLFVNEDYAMDEHGNYFVENFYVQNLSCFFCNFRVIEAEEIDYMKLHEKERVIYQGSGQTQ